MSITRPEMLDEFTRSLVQSFAPSKAQEQVPRGRAKKRPTALNSVMSPLGGREGRAHAYVIMADRLQFQVEAGTLPPDAAEHVQHACDSLMKASAAIRRVEMPRDQNAGTEDQTVR